MPGQTLSPNELNNLITISREDLSAELQSITANGVPVWRKNIAGIMVPVPVDKLALYAGEKTDAVTLYIDGNWKDRVRDNSPVMIETPLQVPALIKRIEQFGNVMEQNHRFQSMSIVEREEILDHGLEKIHEFKGNRQRLDLGIVIRMVEVIAYTFYANHASLEDVKDSRNLKNNIQGILAKSRWIISILIELLRLGIYNYTDFAMIDRIETRSHTFDHIVRVLLKFISFSIFFNDYIDKGLITKNIRASFRERYAIYYRRRLPVDNLSIETIFKNGIRRIDEAVELPDYAMGALLFDMGKLSHLDYHDSTDSHYDEKVVKSHVLHGYNMIINSKAFPFAVSAMAAFHHDYSGNTTGYNFTNQIISRINGISRDESKTRYYIAYSDRDFIDGLALAYFPVKVLEIVDVFDALKNKKNKSPFETLSVMKKEFIAANLKIDPVLFSIFLHFNLKCGLIEMREFQEIERMVE